MVGQVWLLFFCLVALSLSTNTSFLRLPSESPSITITTSAGTALSCSATATAIVAYSPSFIIPYELIETATPIATSSGAACSSTDCAAIAHSIISGSTTTASSMQTGRCCDMACAYSTDGCRSGLKVGSAHTGCRHCLAASGAEWVVASVDSTSESFAVSCTVDGASVELNNTTPTIGGLAAAVDPASVPTYLIYPRGSNLTVQPGQLLGLDAGSICSQTGQTACVPSLPTALSTWLASASFCTKGLGDGLPMLPADLLAADAALLLVGESPKYAIDFDYTVDGQTLHIGLDVVLDVTESAIADPSSVSAVATAKDGLLTVVLADIPAAVTSAIVSCADSTFESAVAGTSTTLTFAWAEESDVCQLGLLADDVEVGWVEVPVDADDAEACRAFECLYRDIALGGVLALVATASLAIPLAAALVRLGVWAMGKVRSRRAPTRPPAPRPPSPPLRVANSNEKEFPDVISAIKYYAASGASYGCLTIIFSSTHFPMYVTLIEDDAEVNGIPISPMLVPARLEVMRKNGWRVKNVYLSIANGLLASDSEPDSDLEAPITLLHSVDLGRRGPVQPSPFLHQ
ncbi:hypothetical protein J8273_0229 [Carpediemonas membranifera]|uniref:Uncharacterized protein n=1 Tax=Carpediemonas membranifera TaxID=201153 RepID=A0A8J6E4W3_9EUKA|nr:hypothetical protein J8273_0229 [Carpediemonas membranifera]|eukprot:KAG9395017.1 hypothetical protein J8273_0229 [Carpediemonas membranifera]